MYLEHIESLLLNYCEIESRRSKRVETSEEYFLSLSNSGLEINSVCFRENAGSKRLNSDKDWMDNCWGTENKYGGNRPAKDFVSRREDQLKCYVLKYLEEVVSL